MDDGSRIKLRIELSDEVTSKIASFSDKLVQISDS